MDILKKPYLVIPKLIEQPTWGGSYILEMKGWENCPEYQQKKIGQSYELFMESKLSPASSSDQIKEGEGVCEVSEFKEKRPFPLIKFTQARGNSFQLHIKQSAHDSKWKPKAESWFYLEDGKATLGIKKNIDIEEYKKVCLDIESSMKKLSALVKNGKLTLNSAKQAAQLFIKEKNPWAFVNVCDVKRGDVIDLSAGGIHHSWEENDQSLLGNIVYEVQQDVDDPSSTIRAFDQGKFKEGGEIREITINDYFNHLDCDEKHNEFSLKSADPIHIFNTPYYCLDHLVIKGIKEEETKTSFHHLFVVSGEIHVSTDNNNSIIVKKGHSCFIPRGIIYTIRTSEDTELLKTFLP